MQRARVVRLCAAVVGSAAADDVAQEVLLEAWRQRTKLVDPSGADAWLGAIARRWCDNGLSSRLDLRAPVYRALVGGVQRPSAIQSRLAGWTRTYWSTGSPQCVRCDAPVTRRRYAGDDRRWATTNGWMAVGLLPALDLASALVLLSGVVVLLLVERSDDS